MTTPQPTVLSRADAVAQHSKTFFTGRPCNRGHVARRYTSTGNCVECARAAAQTFNDKLRGKLREASTTTITLDVHPDDREALFALADFLGQQRGRPPVNRPPPPPVETRTEWEVWYDRLKVINGPAIARQRATEITGGEAHSAGWVDTHVAVAIARPPTYGGGAKPDYL